MGWAPLKYALVPIKFALKPMKMGQGALKFALFEIELFWNLTVYGQKLYLY